ncbi:MAG: zinc ribbon domain-containing protein [Clostridiales bacterium]|nr:zinc ribbon domain-containing protein [Clostridiales bacterium]
MSTITSISALVILPIFLLLFLAIPIMIGVFVYRDAKSRGMNAPLWTLVALVAPGFIGLIIYLIIRSEHSALFCPSCSFRVSENFSVCPNCGRSLKYKCQNCNTPLESGWKICPSCSEPILESAIAEMSARPVAKKDKGIGKLLILIILIPLLLCGLLLIPLFLYRANISENSHISNLSKIENINIQEFEGKPWVTDWLDECSSFGSGVYVLSYEDTVDSRKRTSFLIYRTDIETETELSVSHGGTSTSKLTLSYSDGSRPNNLPYHLTFIEFVGKKHVELKIKIQDPDGKSKNIQYSHKRATQDISPSNSNKEWENVKPAKISIINKNNLSVDAISVKYKMGTTTVLSETFYHSIADYGALDIIVDKTLFDQGVDSCEI